MLVTTGSITTATRLAKIIKNEAGGIADVIHTPTSLKKGGCSYSVRFNDRNEHDVRHLIRKYNIPAKKIYREIYNGSERAYYDIS